MIHRYQMNGKNIVLDVNSGSVHMVDSLVYDLLDHYKEKDTKEIMNLYPENQHNNVKEALEEIRSLEMEGLLFSPDDYNDIHTFDGSKRTLKAMCLHVAHDCNLKCKYCFASQGDFGGKKCIMPFEIGKKALDYLVKESHQRVNLEVDFFGGEPLMNFDVVKRLVDYGNELGEKHGKKFRFTITTNGVLLDDDKIDYINNTMHNVVLSLDGRPEVNDLMRPTLNDKGSYDIIVPKYQKLIQSRGDKYYYVRGTFTRENMDFGKDALHFKELGFNLTSIEPVVDADENPYAIKEEDLSCVLEEYEQFAINYAGIQKDKQAFRFFHFMVDLSQGPCVIKRVSGCGAGVEYLAVTPEGDLYPCHQFVGNEKFKMGNILDEPVQLPKELQNQFLDAHVLAKDDCRNCWAKFYCSGGCHANAWNFNGSMKKPYEMGCAMQKKRLECAFMIEAVKAEL